MSVCHKIIVPRSEGGRSLCADLWGRGPCLQCCTAGGLLLRSCDLLPSYKTPPSCVSSRFYLFAKEGEDKQINKLEARPENQR